MEDNQEYYYIRVKKLTKEQRLANTKRMIIYGAITGMGSIIFTYACFYIIYSLNA